MSVGYDLDGIKGEKINTYINGMTDAPQDRAVPASASRVLTELFPEEKRLHRLHLAARLPQRHRLDAPRLPAAGDRAHRLLSHHGKAPAHLRQVQPDHSRLQDRPHRA
jgi:hypothetical protein